VINTNAYWCTIEEDPNSLKPANTKNDVVIPNSKNGEI